MEEVIYFEFNEKWIKDNQLIIVISNIDMSINFCVTAKKSWVEKNCPNLQKMRINKPRKAHYFSDGMDSGFIYFLCNFSYK